MATYTCSASATPAAPSFLLYVLPTSSDSTPCDVEIDTASNSSFTADLDTTTLVDQTSGATVSTILGPFGIGTTVYVRARAGDGSTWSSYTSTITVVIPSTGGDAVAYMHENVGVLLNVTKDAGQYVDENVGVQLTLTKDAGQYVDENVGVRLVLDKDGKHYIYLGDVNTDQPYPHLWALEPWFGRPGDGVLILGEGMGATQAEYGGVVQMLMGGIWTNVPVVLWKFVAPSADWNTPASAIEPASANIDPQHMEIAILVPVDALPPGHLIRVRTTAP